MTSVVTTAPAVAPAAPPKTKSQALRSFDVADFPALTGREEEWRFTPLRRLRGLATADGSVSAGPALRHEYDGLPAGVSVSTVDKGDRRLGSVLTPFDRISALAWTHASQARLISVARGAVPQQPAVVRLVGPGAEGLAFGHTYVEVGELAEATLVLDHVGSVTLADNVEVSVGSGARLTLITVTDWAPDAVQAQHVKFRLGRDAKLVHIQVSLGGDLVRQYLSVDYTDRGALQGDGAHTIWVGDVLIRAEATGTDTYEINRNLVLSDGARADSVPNLEIETGEVIGAGHASATGRFDDEQLFYLMSRGVSEAEARKLVVRGFFAELLNKIPVESLHDRLAASIETRLAASVLAPEAPRPDPEHSEAGG